MIQRVEVEEAIVIIGPDAAEVGAALRDATDRGARAGAFVGSADEAAFRPALEEMIDELYGRGGSIS